MPAPATTAPAQASSSAAVQLKQQCIGNFGVCFSYNPNLTIEDKSQSDELRYDIIREGQAIMGVRTGRGWGGGCTPGGAGDKGGTAEDASVITTFTPVDLGTFDGKPANAVVISGVEQIKADTFVPLVALYSPVKATGPGPSSNCELGRDGIVVNSDAWIVHLQSMGNQYPTVEAAKAALQERQFTAAEEIMLTVTRA